MAGTPLGDPIEVSAIGRVLCKNREKTLYLGQLKLMLDILTPLLELQA